MVFSYFNVNDLLMSQFIPFSNFGRFFDFEFKENQIKYWSLRLGYS